MKAQPALHDGHPVTTYYRPDDPQWHWLEQRNDKDVSTFLAAANQQHDAWFKPLAPLADALYESHLSRRELSVTSLATTLDHFTFWSETAADEEYPRWWRHPNGQSEATECILAVPDLAAGQAFYDMGDMALSPDESWLAWTDDTQGDERFNLWLKRLPDGQPIHLLSDIGPSLCWAEDQTHDSGSLLFTRFDDTQRPDSIWCLPIAFSQTPQPQPATLLLRENDPEFWLGMGKTRSRNG